MLILVVLNLRIWDFEMEKAMIPANNINKKNPD